jgi:hypothetical protein
MGIVDADPKEQAKEDYYERVKKELKRRQG